MSPMSPESTVVRNYLDWLLSIPWAKRSKIKKDLKLAQEVLDNDHYGLDKIKERIVEYLAVQQRANKLTGPILCLVGPAGVGKTSLGKSIARATGRDFVRFSLGGVHYEAEIRGVTGGPISAPCRARSSSRCARPKTSNPLFLLDEVDKLGSDFRGDRVRHCSKCSTPSRTAPSATTTSTSTTISRARCSSPTANDARPDSAPAWHRTADHRTAGYTLDEKVEIATQHLVPQALKEHGLDFEEWSIGEEALSTSSSATRARRACATSSASSRP